MRNLSRLKQAGNISNIDERYKHRFKKAFIKEQAEVANIILAFSILRALRVPYEQIKAMSES